MPREKTNYRHLLKGWISGKECFTTDGDILYCQVCNQMVNCAKKYHIKQHEETQAHKRNLTKIQAGEAGPKQTLLTERLQTRQNPFFYDLCNLLTSCNIPWNKVENPVFKKFFADYCNKEIPSESTLRKNYLPLVYKEKIQTIQNYIGVNDIWIVVDETTDARGKYICNIIVGKLSGESPSVPCLLVSKVLPQCNHATVSRFINSSLAILWPEQIYHERVRIMYSDAAAYMKKCGVALKVFYPNLYHITCLAHALSLVCEVIRHHFEDVNGLIKSVKQFFLKAPLRVQCYKEKLPNVPLPPEPILTRWGTWLEAAMFHAEHFNGIKEVVLAFDGESRAIRDAQNCYKNNNIFRDLAYIQSNFKILTTAIKELETQGLPLSRSFEIIHCVEKSLEETPGLPAEIALNKLKSVLIKNPNFKDLEDISKVLSGDLSSSVPLINGVEMTAEDINKFKFAPMTSCDVERSFSAYKQILTDKRHSLSDESIEQILVIYCQANKK